ncbi:MAG: MASE3 domain-containing protein [Bacillota bacterium]|nr:MASE3 domain-containing protein [Bacillota bacterium]
MGMNIIKFKNMFIWSDSKHLNITEVLFKYLLILIISSIISYALSHSIWKKDVVFIHSILELMCIFVSMTAFAVVWYTYESNPQENIIIGFGFLMIGVINAHHTYYFIQNFNSVNAIDLSLKYSVLGRLAESVILLISSGKALHIKLNKWLALLATAASTIVISFGMSLSTELFPKLYSGNGATIARIICEYTMVIISILTLIILYKNFDRKSIITNKFVFLAILVAIPTELCFTLFKNLTSFQYVLAHTFKVIYYFLLFKGIFISAVTYPYRKMENAYNQSEEKFRGAFEHAATGMAIVGLDGGIFKVNRALCEITGYCEEELLNKSFKDITKEEDCEAHSKFSRQLLEGKIQRCHMESRYIHKDGYQIWILLSGSLVRDNHGTPLYFIAQIQNITEIKNAHEALENDKLKTDFFANISHELRTPVNIIMSSAQLIALYLKDRLVEDDKLKKQLKTLKQNSYRLIRLINNLIDSTKIDAGFYSLQLQKCDIVNVIENITSSVAEYIKSKGLEVEFNTNAAEKNIICDPEKIERIMMNLLSNAVKFSCAKGKIAVNIYVNKDFVVISVKDNGIGIEKDKLEMIFEKFGQIDKSLTRNHGGSGIGLSLTKELVNLHGGNIEVLSEFGYGSEFLITLPSGVAEENNDCIGQKNISTFNESTEENRIERINIEFSDLYL